MIMNNVYSFMKIETDFYGEPENLTPDTSLGYYTDFVTAFKKWVEIESDILDEYPMYNRGYQEDCYEDANGNSIDYPDEAYSNTGFTDEWERKIYVQKDKDLENFLLTLYTDYNTYHNPDRINDLMYDGHYLLVCWKSN